MKSKYTKKQFLLDVAKEAKALKKNATKKELDNLDFTFFDFSSFSGCIYGQVAGDCTNKRGVSLIEKCCKRFVDINNIGAIKYQGFPEIARHINGSKPPFKRSFHSLKYLSSIEAYIVLPNAKNKNLIAYLKGERKDLVL